MREGEGKTGKVKEYRLKDPIIELNLKLENTKSNTEDIVVYKDLYDSLIKRTEGVYGSIPYDKHNLGKVEKIDNKEDLIKSIRRLLEFNEKTMGLNSTRKLVKRSKEDIFESQMDIKKIHSFFEGLPPKYFDLIKEEYE